MQTMLVGAKPAPSSPPIHQRQPMSSSSQIGTDSAQGEPVLAVSTIESHPPTHDRLLYYRGKRLFDLAVVILTLGLIWPIIGLIALAIILDSSGTVLVGQKRIGVRRQRVNGQTHWQQTHFVAYQFRTVQDNLQVTRVGKFLHQTSLYELPQLLNILKGDISLVGPRPAQPADVARYSAWHRQRLESMQGMTGLWQLQDCRNLSFHSMVQLDINYIENQSFWLDLQILFRTLLAAMRIKSAE